MAPGSTDNKPDGCGSTVAGIVVGLILAITLTLATPAAAGQCHVAGNARKQVCLCFVGGHWHGFPMRLCR